MHILIIPSWYPNSSSSLSGIFFKEQAEALARHGHKIGVIAIQNPMGIKEIIYARNVPFKYKHYIENKVTTYRVEFPSIPKLRKLRNFIKKIVFKIEFKKYIKKNGLPDMVHLHSFILGDFAIWIKEKYKIPYVVTEHSSGFARKLFSEKDIKLAKKVYSYSNYNIAVSEKYVDLLQNKFNLKFHFIPNPVQDFFLKNKLNNKHDNKNYVFINIAGLNKNKNQSTLIKSFSKAFSNQKKVKLLIVGNGSEYNNLSSLISTLKLEKQVELFGQASREQILNLLHKSNAFVLSSYYETFGISIIEAMASGLPVISTKCGGPESIVISPKLGLLCDINVDAMKKSLLKLYNNRKVYSSEYIKNYTIENYSEEVICKKLEIIYKKIVSKNTELKGVEK